MSAANIDESTLTIFVPAWGDKHLGYLRDYALPSVMQPGNLPACSYSKIFVEGSTIGEPAYLREILTSGMDGLPVEVHCVDYGDESRVLLMGLRHAIISCLHRRSRMLLMMPDTIFANGGIANMREYARNKPVSVAGIHLRVNAITFCASAVPRRTSRELVNAAHSHAHQSFTDSFSDRDNGTNMGGISLTRISDRLTTVQHYLPTVYLAWFEQSDVDFFNKAPWFGEYDHTWDQHLNNEGRLRVIGCSETFFAVELTDPARNRISVVPGSRTEEHSEFGCLALKPLVGCLHH